MRALWSTVQALPGTFWRFAQCFWADYREAACQKSAAALTYMTLFALVPSLMVIYSIFSMVPAFEAPAAQLQGVLFANLLPESSRSLQLYLERFSGQARSLTLPGVAMMLITALMMLNNIEKNFNTLWGVSNPRRGLIKYLRYWAVISIGPVLLAMTLVMSTYVLSLKLAFNADLPSPEFVAMRPGLLVAVPWFFDRVPWLLEIVPWLLMTGVFTLLFVVVPNCHVPLRYALWGGAVTALCFQWVKKFFAWFVATSNFELVYGVFAAVPVFLIWLNVLWMIVLSGAVLVRTLSDRRYLKSPLRKTDLALALECLALFYQAQKTGRLISDGDCLGLGLGVVQWHQLKQQWQKARWLVETPGGDYALCRNLAQTRLWDLACLLRTPLSDLAAAMPADMPGWQGEFAARRVKLSEAALTHYGVPLSQLFDEAINTGSDTEEIPHRVTG